MRGSIQLFVDVVIKLSRLTGIGSVWDSMCNPFCAPHTPTEKSHSVSKIRNMLPEAVLGSLRADAVLHFRQDLVGFLGASSGTLRDPLRSINTLVATVFQSDEHWFVFTIWLSAALPITELPLSDLRLATFESTFQSSAPRSQACSRRW